MFGGGGLHPAVCAGAGVDGVAKEEACRGGVWGVVNFGADFVQAVVHHSGRVDTDQGQGEGQGGLPLDIPHRLRRLPILMLIKSTNQNTLNTDKPANRQINMPMQPRPKLPAMSNRCIGILPIQSTQISPIHLKPTTHLPHTIQPPIPPPHPN